MAHIPTYQTERARFCQNYSSHNSEHTRTDAIRQSPLVSLAVKYATDFPEPHVHTSSNACTNGLNTASGRLTTESAAAQPNSPTGQTFQPELAPTLEPSILPIHPSGEANKTQTPSSKLLGSAPSFQPIEEHIQAEETVGEDDETGPLALPQYGLLGFDLNNRNSDDGSPEPMLLNTNTPSSVFLCGSQGSGKSYTLSCMLENHLLNDDNIDLQTETLPGFVFHWDTNTSGYVAEAASLCSRGVKVRVLVSWSNYLQMKELYEEFGREAGGTIEVRPLLFENKELTVGHIRNLMAFEDASQGVPLYFEVIQNILRKYGRGNQGFSVKTFLKDVGAESFAAGQLRMLEQRLSLLKSFSAATAPDIVKADYPKMNHLQLAQQLAKQGLNFTGDCIRVEKGTLTIVDLSDPFVDANTACTLFDICHSIMLKRHKDAVTVKAISPGLIISLDEAHKFLDKDLPAAAIFTSSLLTTIREQRHNAARVVIATQEPSISEKLLDLCSISIVHRFSSPAWFTAIADHLGGASSMTVSSKDGETAADKRAELFNRILALRVGESLVFSPTSWVRGGQKDEDGKIIEPTKLGSEVLWMKTRERKGEDAGRTVNVV